VGQSVTSGALSISNTASGASGYVEDLNAQFGAVNANSGTGTAGIVGNGSISGLRAGSTNNSSMTVTVTGTAAGTIVSGIGVDFITAGTVNGVSDGLGTASVGSATYGIDGSIGGTVISQADPVINNPTIDLGNVRIGSASPTGSVSVTNQATSSPQAALDASISGTAPISGSGSFSLLAPGSTDSSSLRVGMSTATAGAVSGTATVALVSDASNVGGCGSSCTLTLPSQNVTVTGNVYQVAQPSLPTAVNVGNYHVGGGLVSQTVTISNTLNAPVGYQEGLDASAGATTGEATISGGPISNLAAGSSSSALSVGLTGTAAGASSGTVTVNLASDGAGTSGLGILSLPSQTIDVSGTGYNLAAGSTTPSPITIGNQRVGGTNSQALTVGNTAPSGSYTEVLNASFGANGGNAINNGGAISGGLGAGGIAGGSVNDTAMSVGVDTASAGAKSGTVAVNYVSNGTGTSGLGNTGVGSETITVSGNVYQAAQGQLNNTASNPDTFNFGTIQVGQSVTSGALSISNTASGASGYVEDLNAQFGAVNANSGTGTAGIVGNGSISGLRAGSTNNSSMTVTVTGTAAGTIVSGIGVDFITAGTVNGVSDGLGTASVGSATYGIDGSIGGTVISQADPVINNPTIDLGNVRIGSASPTGSVSVTNQATSSPQAALDASISGTAPISGSGSFSLLAPGSTDSSSLRVGMSTATAGAVSGTATVALVSDASNVGGCGSSCKLTLPSQSVTVSGAVYRLASPTLNTSSVTIAARVGDASPAAAVSVTNASPDAYTEGLAASMGSAPNGWTSSGSISNLAAGGTDASSLRVSLDTANAGTVNGSQTVNFTSNGLVDNATPESLGSQSVQLNGSVYTPAVEQVITTTVDFGVVHVGQSVGPQTVSVTNGAQSTALNDVLTGSLTGSSGPFTASGTLGSGLGAGQGSGSDLSVALDTGTAGVYSDTAEFSGASHDSQLSDLQLATVGIGMSAQVNNYADAAFALDSGSGSLSRSGSDYLLNFGDITQGSGVSSLLSLLNSVTGPADNLEGSFALGALTDVSLSGTNWSGSFSGLGAGQSLGGLGIDVNSALVGNFNDTITLDGMGYYGGATYNPYVDNITLTLEGDVVNSVPSSVPEPGSLALFVMGGMMLAAMATRRRRRLQSNSGRD
jgi:hypothetical protein